MCIAIQAMSASRCHPRYFHRAHQARNDQGRELFSYSLLNRLINNIVTVFDNLSHLVSRCSVIGPLPRVREDAHPFEVVGPRAPHLLIPSIWNFGVPRLVQTRAFRARDRSS